MQPPRRTPKHPDYQLDLEEALEDRVIDAIADAIDAGWDQTVLWRALRSLIDNLEDAEAAVRELEAIIAAGTAPVAGAHSNTRRSRRVLH